MTTRNSGTGGSPRTDNPLGRVRWIDLPGNPEGPRLLTVVEFDAAMPFDVQRIYWLHSLDGGEMRGHHAHRGTQQMLIAASGSFKLRLDDGFGAAEYVLDDPGRAVLIPAGLWREIEVIGARSVLLVLASSHFDEADYIRDYDDYLAFARDKAGPGQPL